MTSDPAEVAGATARPACVPGVHAARALAVLLFPAARLLGLWTAPALGG